MDIVLVRHAESALDLKWQSDASRPLSKEGIEDQTRATKGMRKIGLDYNIICVSPLYRAQQTLQIIQNVYKKTLDFEIVDDLDVWGNPNAIYEKLETQYNQHPDSKLLIVAHNPNISELLKLIDPSGHRLMDTSDVAYIIWENNHCFLKRYYRRGELINLGSPN